MSRSQSMPEEKSSRDEGSITQLTGTETAALVDSVQTWRYRVDSRQHGFFLAKKQKKDIASVDVQGEYSTKRENDGEDVPIRRPNTPETPNDILDFTWAIGSLAEYERDFFEGIPLENQYLCFVDPSTYPNYPGWMLRNFLVLIRKRWKLDRAQVLCYRDVQSRRDGAKSIVLHLELDQDRSASPTADDLAPNSSQMPKVTGWERNNAGKVMSRIANLGEYMDPLR